VTIPSGFRDHPVPVSSICFYCLPFTSNLTDGHAIFRPVSLPIVYLISFRAYLRIISTALNNDPPYRHSFSYLAAFGDRRLSLSSGDYVSSFDVDRLSPAKFLNLSKRSASLTCRIRLLSLVSLLLDLGVS
jgi:hypothetical protein